MFQSPVLTGELSPLRSRRRVGRTDLAPPRPMVDPKLWEIKSGELRQKIDALTKLLAGANKDQIEGLAKTLAELVKQHDELKASLKPAGDVQGLAKPIDLPKMKFDIKIPTNAELAGNLKGHLLLVHGEIDNNVHPANTMRLVDALIKANKRFELLIIPGARHGFGPDQPYFTDRMWDFFAEHLLEDRQTKSDIKERDSKKK